MPICYRPGEALKDVEAFAINYTRSRYGDEAIVNKPGGVERFPMEEHYFLYTVFLVTLMISTLPFSTPPASMVHYEAACSIVISTETGFV